MKINEIFKSIQGETSYAGLPCAFIRITGCNLRCSYCDTTYAYYDGTEMSINSIIECPCLMCSSDPRCGAFGSVSPIACNTLNEWILVLAEGRADISGDS